MPARTPPGYPGASAGATSARQCFERPYRSVYSARLVSRDTRTIMDQPVQPPPRDPRTPVNLRIKFRSENIDQFIERYAIAVSRGEIFIRTREPLAVGTVLK